MMGCPDCPGCPQSPGGVTLTLHSPAGLVQTHVVIHTHDDAVVEKVMMTALSDVDEGVDGVDKGSPDDLDAQITHRVRDFHLVVRVVSPFWYNLKTGNCTDSSSCYRAARLNSTQLKGKNV